MHETALRIILMIVAVGQSAFSVVFMKKSAAGTSLIRRREEGVLLSALLGVCYLGYCYGVVVFMIDPRWLAWGTSGNLPMWCRWIGVVPLVGGAIWVFRAFAALAESFAFSVSPKEQNTLVTAGPYRWVRHPLYTGFLVEAVGVSLMTASWFIGLSAAALWGLLVYRTDMEERKLVQRYGDEYRRYMKTTGRFFPRLRK